MSSKMWLALIAIVVVILFILSGLTLSGNLGLVTRAISGNDFVLPALSQAGLALFFFALAMLGAAGYAFLGEQLGFWTVVNPSKEDVCPVCFRRLHVGDCQVVSSFDQTKIIEKAPTGLRRVINRVLVPALAGERYAQEHAARECPYCSNLLPTNLEYAESIYVALVGGALAGKSLYTAALIHQLENSRLLETIGCSSFRALDHEVEDRYRKQYNRPLFEEHVPLARTPRLSPEQFVKPLTYVMEFKRGGRIKRVNLALYDGAGEGMEDATELAQAYRCVANASAIIFLVDPMTLPRFPQQLPPHLRPATRPRAVDSARLLASVTREVQLVRRVIHGSSTIDVPIAITLSKSDLIRWVVPQADLTFLNDPPADPALADGEMKSIDEQVRQLLEQFEGASLLHAADAFANRAFFAVSATGCPEQDGRFAAVCPRRAVDPLLWALSRLGVIDNLVTSGAKSNGAVSRPND